MNNSNSSLCQEEKKCRICFEEQSTNKSQSCSKSHKSLRLRKGLRSLRKPFHQSASTNSLSSCCSLNELIYPCKCSGSMKYVHSKCLEKWREACYGTEGYFCCHQCKSPYEMQHSRLQNWLNLHTFCILLSCVIFIGHFMAVHLVLHFSRVIPLWFGTSSSQKVQLIHSAIFVSLLQLLVYSVQVFLAILLLFSWFRWLKILHLPGDAFERNLQVIIIAGIVFWAFYQNIAYFGKISKRLSIPLYKSVPVSRKKIHFLAKSTALDLSKGK